MEYRSKPQNLIWQRSSDNKISDGIPNRTATAQESSKNNTTLQPLPYQASNERIHGLVKTPKKKDLDDEPKASQLRDLQTSGLGMEELKRDWEKTVHWRGEKAKNQTHAGLSWLQIPSEKKEQDRDVCQSSHLRDKRNVSGDGASSGAELPDDELPRASRHVQQHDQLHSAIDGDTSGDLCAHFYEA